MRKRYREPKIYRKDGLYWFRITDSFGKRQEVRAFTDREAKFKRADMIKQLFSDLSGNPTYRITFEQGVDFWLKIKKDSIDETSYARYSSHMDNFLEFIKTKRTNLRHFDEIRPEHIKEFMDYRLNEKRRATKTVNSERTALNNLFTVLIDYNKIPEINPVAKVKPFKVIKVQKRRCLTDDELSKFFDGAKAESGSINWYGIYFTLYITGMRRDEVRNLDKESVDLTSGFITILNTKTDKPKAIPIHPQLKPILQQAMEQSRTKLVFPDSNGELLERNKFRYKMRNICDKVGIEKATPHDLRHTFASRQGLSDRVKQIIGGWSSKQVMENTYIHTPEDYVRDEYFKVDFIPKPKKLMAS